MKLTGVLPPIVTPFDASGEIDFEVLGQVLAFHRESGVSGIVACGTTGEYYALDHAERLKIMAYIKEQAGEGLTLIAGTNAGSTREAIELTRQAAEMGYDGIMLAPPFYSLPSQEELLAHFRQVIDAVDLPFCLYDFPQRAGVQIGFEVLDALADDPKVVAIKEANGDFGRTIHLAGRYGGRIDLVCGADEQIVDFMTWGSQCWIGGIANVLPRQHVEVVEAVRAGDVAGALATLRKVQPFIAYVEAGLYTQKVKYALEVAGYPVGPCRAPLMPLPADVQAETRRLYEEAVS